MCSSCGTQHLHERGHLYLESQALTGPRASELLFALLSTVQLSILKLLSIIKIYVHRDTAIYISFIYTHTHQSSFSGPLVNILLITLNLHADLARF